MLHNNPRRAYGPAHSSIWGPQHSAAVGVAVAPVRERPPHIVHGVQLKALGRVLQHGSMRLAFLKIGRVLPRQHVRSQEAAWCNMPGRLYCSR